MNRILLFAISLLLGGACIGNAPFNPANPAASGFSLIFSDNFPGTSLDPTKWCPNYPSAASCNALGPTTNPNQISSCDPAHVTVSNGAVHLLLTNNTSNGYPTDGACISTDLTPETGPGNPLASFQPPATSTGAIWIEATITFPDDGSHLVRNEPSMWLNGVTPGHRICVPGWPNCDEIDIAEFYTCGVTTNYHDLPNDFSDPTKNHCTSGTFTGTHKYQLMWTNSAVSYYVDGNMLFTTTNIDAQSHPMYLVFFNIADNRTVNVMPSTMDISGVYVWSHP